MKRTLLLVVSVLLALVAAAAIYVLMEKSDRAATSESLKQPVTFRIHAPDAKAVFVTGSFNAWKTVEFLLEKKDGGMWETTIPIAPGRYEYKFVVDSVWMYDPGNPIKVPVPLPYTGYNSVLEVKRTDK